jgi:20S proteasome alpha/beta subunit
MKQWEPTHPANILAMTNLGDIIFMNQKRKPIVTIIIGIICKNSIVLASDSQTTYGTIQRLDTPKISTLDFANVEVLIAQSGNVTLSARAVEILTELSAGKKLDDYRAVADMAQKALRKVKDELREQNFDCGSEELHKHIHQNGLNFELMIAHFYNGKPYIYTIDFAVGIATKSSHPFIAIGCGSGLATYILSWFGIGKSMPTNHGMIAALYTIEEVKKVDPYCGGKTRVAILAPGGIQPGKNVKDGMTSSDFLKMMLETDHDDYVAALAKIDQKAKAEWAIKMNQVLLEGNRTMLEARKNKGN